MHDLKNHEKLQFRRYRPIEGHTDVQRLHADALELAERIAPLITKDSDLSAADKIRDAARKAKSLKLTVQNYRINRRRYKSGNHALRPLYIIWTMLNSCNFRCSYCDNHQGEHYFDMPDDNRLNTGGGKKLLDLMITGSPALYWCGGEPTMRDDLPELLDYAWNLGFFPNMINTNAALLHAKLAKPNWRNFLRQMDMVIVSLDGLHKRRLNKLWGVKQADRVLTNLLMLRSLQEKVRFKLAVNTVITPDSIDEARSVLDLADDLGVWFVPVPVNYHHAPDRGMLKDPAYVELSNLILKRKKAGAKIIGSPTLLKRLLKAEPYRCITALKPHVWPNGEICWPCRASRNVEPVNINLLDYESFDDAYEAGRKLVNPDFFHGHAKNQCGGECAWMQNYTTARYMDGVVAPMKSGLAGEVFEFALKPSK